MTQRVSQPDLLRMMDKKLAVRINANRKVVGVLRGFDQFMNLVLDDAQEEFPPKHEKAPTVAASRATAQPPLPPPPPPPLSRPSVPIGTIVIRGNSVSSLEALEKI